MHTATEAVHPRAIENPVNGERVVFRRTARDTAGASVECDFHMEPGGGSPMAHVHARQDERVRVVSGTATYTVGRRATPSRLPAAESLLIPAGTPHRIWNEDGEELHLTIEFTPALEVEGLLETLFALAAAGRTDRRGRPRLADRIILARDHEVFAPGPPLALQRALVRLLAPVVRPISAVERHRGARI